MYKWALSGGLLRAGTLTPVLSTAEDHQSLQNRGKCIMQTDGLAQLSLFHILNSFIQVFLFLKLASLLSASMGTKPELVCLLLSFCSTSYKVWAEDMIREKTSEVSRACKKGCWLNESKILTSMLWFMVYPPHWSALALGKPSLSLGHCW